MVRVIHADTQLFFCTFLRSELALRPEPVCAGVEVVPREPEPGDPMPERLVVVETGGSTRTEIVTDEEDVRISVLAGTKENPKDANDLARIVRAIAEDAAAVEAGNPVAAVVESRGPFPVPEAHPHARRLITLVVSTAGTAL